METRPNLHTTFVQLTDAFLEQLACGTKDFSCRIATQWQCDFAAKVSFGPAQCDPFTDPMSESSDEEAMVSLSRPEGYDSQDWEDTVSAFRSAVEARLELDFGDPETRPMAKFVIDDSCAVAFWLTGETLECESGLELLRRIS